MNIEGRLVWLGIEPRDIDVRFDAAIMLLLFFEHSFMNLVRRPRTSQ